MKENENTDNFQNMLNALPYCTALLDKEFRLVTYNKRMQDKIGINNLKGVLSERPGHVFGCVHAQDGLKCGQTDKCSECSLNQLINHYEISDSISLECKIISVLNGSMNALELKVHISSVNLGKDSYIIMTLENQNEHKRKELLNRTFMHDLINTATGLTSLIDYIELTEDTKSFSEYSPLIKKQAAYIIEEIRAHKGLLTGNTENKSINYEYCISDDIMKCSFEVIHHFATLHKVSIRINSDNFNTVLLHTDPTLIRRVLVNLLKNAIEASNEHDTVEVGCISSENNAVFYIKNGGVMTEETKQNLFNRIYSTKSEEGGIGSLSIKLLTEKYLNGQVSFSSDEEQGTIFYVSLPMANPAKAVDDIILSTEHISPLS